MKVLVLHSLPPEAPSDRRATWEFDIAEGAQSVASVLPGAVVEGVRGQVDEVLSALSCHRPDVVFNACEAPLGRPELEAHVAALFEWLGVRFTGSGSETLALCRRKDRVNAALAYAGVPVPRSGRFPCIVKPADQDGSAGIFPDSVCMNAAEVERARRRISGRVLVEEFVPGREFAVSLWGRDTPEHMSIGETRFRDLRLNTYDAKWEVRSRDFENTPMSYDVALDDDMREMVTTAARGAWRIAEVRGYLRVDVRLDADGVARVLDVNPNPELTPGAGIHRAVIEAGWTWERFVRKLVEWA